MAETVASSERLDGGHVKGTMLRSRFRWFQDNHASAMDDFRKLLPPELAKEFSSGVSPDRWYPFRWLIVLDRTIADFVGGGAEIFEELGRYSASLNLATAYAGYSRESPHAFLENQAALHREFQDFGTAEYVRRGPKSGAMIHRDYGCYSPVFCASAPGYYKESVAFHGGAEVGVVETTCQCRNDSACTFEISWR